MPAKQWEGHGESLAGVLRQRPDAEVNRGAGSPASLVVTRNAHDQSLDDAREAFRAEWAAKIDQKRQ